MFRPNNLSFQNGGQPMPQQGGDQAAQIMQMVAQALQQGTPPEQVMQMLIQQGIPQDQAQQIIQQVMSQMQGQGQQNPVEESMEGQPQMQQGGFNIKPKYLGVKPNSIDSLFYKSDFYGTPDAATVNMNYYKELPKYQGLTPKNLAQKDYVSQLFNLIKSNPSLKKKAEKMLPIDFKNTMRPNKLTFDY